MAREGAEEWTVVTADSQTSGRGRRGRTWEKLDGENLYCSIVLYPRGDIETWAAFSLVVGLAVCECIDEFTGDVVETAQTLLKWPNDILIGGRKAGGVLIESSSKGRVFEWMVVGVGVNVTASNFGRLTATSLAREGIEVSPRRLALSLIEKLKLRYEMYSRGQDLLPQINQRLDRETIFKMPDDTTGQQVRVEAGGVLFADTMGREKKFMMGELTWET